MTVPGAATQAVQRSTHNTTAVLPLTATGNLFPLEINGSGQTAGAVDTSGYATAILEMQLTGSGSATILPKGSYDGGKTWYALGYQQINAVASPARAVSAFALASNTNATLSILDAAPLMEFVVTVTGTVSIAANLYKVP